ncbi:MAG: type I DNA topoisomerase [Oscillospiraceae bacterium]|jgi:DNA topoisomerase-1|nr:type I DNA topoisomerase [Oscillospiraceae bacterium]
MQNLVIVESPAKAKTIGKYLGSGYKVTASVGHIRDLPKSKLGVDIDNNFTPEYINSRDKTAVIKEIRSLAQKSDMVYLATDPDREGEAISWHLAHILNIPENAPVRVTFNEITKTGVKKGMDNPRTLNMNLIDAQQGRRVLDRIVGYKLSPFLWKKVKRGLSAGRVQSVAVRLLCDREREISAFTPVEYHTVDGVFLKNRKQFKAAITDVDGVKITKDNITTVSTAAQAEAITSRFTPDTKFTVTDVKKSERRKQPSPPFTTSALQQDASGKLGFSPKRTMKAAQELYEGVDTKEYGTIGLITYMRTDSVRVSDEAMTAARDFISAQYGEQYVPKTPRVFKSKGNAQDGHEAIRPSIPSVTPDSVAGDLTSDQLKLYRLVWARFIASQTEAAVYDTVTAHIEAENCIFRASGSTVKFDGFTKVYNADTEKDEKALPPLDKGNIVNAVSIDHNQHFTQPPPRYTEASLIKALEENGIGRPSTYAPTISTIIDRNYAERNGKQLLPTILGDTVTDLLIGHFPDIVNPSFTAAMETDLDKVEAGYLPWTEVIKGFYGGFADTLAQAEHDLEGKRIKLPEIVTDIPCEVCGKPMLVKIGKFGKFLGCSGFPDCTFTKQITEAAGGNCPKCGEPLIKRKSKKGRTYFACPTAPCGFMTWDIPVADKCPTCNRTMFKKGARVYCANCDVAVPQESQESQESQGA